jgi:hypothetical protein
MSTRVMTALHLHPPAYTPSSDGKTMGWSLSPHSRTHGVQFHGRMHLRVMITPHNTRLAVPPLQLDGKVQGFDLRGTCRGTACRVSGHVQLPTNPITSRASAGECATPTLRSQAIHRNRPSPRVAASQRASARTTSMLHVTVAPAPSCRVTARRTECGRGVCQSSARRPR